MKFRGLFITAGLALAATGVASANTIVQSFSLPSGSITTDWTGTTQINKFNPTTGTLENIQFIADMTSLAQAGAIDSSGNSSGDSYTISATTTLTLSDPFSNLLISPANSITSSYSNQHNGEAMNVSQTNTIHSLARWGIDPSDVFSFACLGFTPGCLEVSSNAGSPSNPLNFAGYEGFGQLTLTANAKTLGSFGGGPFTNGFATGSALVNVTVVYEYTPAGPPSSTPEPATMALFGGGLVGVALLSRRRFRKS
jgi:hypothetical protein